MQIFFLETDRTNRAELRAISQLNSKEIYKVRSLEAPYPEGGHGQGEQEDHTLSKEIHMRKRKNNVPMREIVLPGSECAVFLKKARPVIQQCLEIIEQAGLSAADAEAIPDELLDAIRANNEEANNERRFQLFRKKGPFDN